MTFLDRTRGTDDPRPVWFLVERETYGAMATARTTRSSALAGFAEWLRQAHDAGEGYTPRQRRALQVIGPNVFLRADGDDAVRYSAAADPAAAADVLVARDVALRAVLAPDEYQLYVTGPVAAALLES
jgi:hypothetical protein